MTKQRIMAVFAHPDDEGQVAGLTAKYAARGLEVFLVCATRGERGVANDPSLLSGKTMAQLREEELRCACKALGVKGLQFLGFKEGSFHTADSSQVIDRLSAIIQDIRPQVMITFRPERVYGHRDHLAVSRWVTSVFYAVRKRTPSQCSQFPLKLYYTAYPRSLFDRLRSKGLEFKIGIDGRIHGIHGVRDDQITTIIDVADFQSHKVEALRCHRSQSRPGDFRWMVMEGRLMELLVTERLVRVFPPPDGNREIEKDLFPVLKG